MLASRRQSPDAVWLQACGAAGSMRLAFDRRRCLIVSTGLAARRSAISSFVVSTMVAMGRGPVARADWAIEVLAVTRRTG